MIILCSSESKKNFKKIIDEYKETEINLRRIECPHCKSDNLIKWGSYTRNIYYIENSSIEFDVIKIQRVRCKECGHTHALLPNFIVPYRQHALDVIILSIENNKIIDKYNFSEDTIEKWRKQFREFLPYIKTMLSISNKDEIIRRIKENIFDFYREFYRVNKKILMMIRHGILNMAYF